MTKKVFLLLTFIFSVFHIHAQWNQFSYDSVNYVFGDTAFIRAQPSTVNSLVTDTLFAADMVRILEKSESSLTLKGISAPWFLVSYKKDSVEKTGYIWSGLLAFNAVRRGDTKFVCGANRIITKDTVLNGVKDCAKVCLIGIKVFRHGDKLASTQFNVLYYEELFRLIKTEVTGHLGLKNVENIVSVVITGEACDIPEDSYYFGFRKNEIVPVYNAECIASAGLYYHNEILIFPAQKGGKENTIIWKMEHGEDTEKLDKKGEPIYKKKYDRKELLWDGDKAVAK
jgi:hypothetical protein